MGKLVTCLLVVSTLAFGGGATDRDVASWIKKWAPIVGLSDWTITGKVVPLGDLPPNTLGHSEWFRVWKSGELHVLRKEDYPKHSKDIYTDQELTVVHELVHMKVSYLLNPESDQEVVEQVVRDLATAVFEGHQHNEVSQRTLFCTH